MNTRFFLKATALVLVAQLHGSAALAAGGAKVIPHAKENHCPETEVPMEADSRDGITVTPATQTDICIVEETAEVGMFTTPRVSIESDIDQEIEIYFATAKTEEECKALTDDCKGYKLKLAVKSGKTDDVDLFARGKGLKAEDAKYACYSVFKAEETHQ